MFRAKKDGVLESIDEEHELAVVRYNDGKKDVIDLSEHMSKNSNGGFKGSR
ncbi:putative RNA polymerase beta subunit [Bacillus phage vB_BspM_Internexus]|nr:putative RNA polymerase beta subunit [Bacillus phage vB_BspM_Internexus]